MFEFFRAGKREGEKKCCLGGGGGGSTNSVEDRENGDLGAVAP